MVYLISPVGHPVEPVMVKPDVTFEFMVDGLEALGMVEEFLDPDWLEGESGAPAEADRMAQARAHYEQLRADDRIAPALRSAGCAPGVEAALEEFFGYLADADGRHLTVQRLS